MLSTSLKSTKSLTTFHLHLTLIIIFVTTIKVCSPERVHWHRNESEDREPHPAGKFIITNENQCRAYLCKYGYLNCNCTEYLVHGSSRYRRSIDKSLIPVEYDEDPTDKQFTDLPTILTTPNTQACTAENYRSGYIRFQQVYRLAQTGGCDERTMDYMSRSRCGQPDYFDTDSSPPPQPPPAEVPAVRTQRSKLTLHNILQRRSEMREAMERRRQMLLDYINAEHGKHETYGDGKSVRKRSILDIHLNNEGGGIMTKKRISWRLMSSYVNPTMPVAVQNGVLKHAFRYWSEISPLCFEEKKSDPQVDIEIGFLEGVHLNCFKQFDGYGGEIAHKFIRDVHFDKQEPYTDGETTENTISLLLVAVHEIGHVLGFNHSMATGSVMNAIYHRNIKGNFELSDHDRAEVLRAYGPCTGKLDLVFDLARTSGSTRVFNTYIFKENKYWQYENQAKRPRYGDPQILSNQWNGLPSNLDAFVQYFTNEEGSKNVYDEYYFFKGDRYYQYSVSTDRVIGQGLIRSKFKSGPDGAVPINIDSAHYDYITKAILFFKGDKVWRYSYRATGDHSCCTSAPSRIQDMFPPLTNADLTAPNGDTYANNIDSVYFSWSTLKLYFIKNDSAWVVEGYNLLSSNQNQSWKVKYLGPWTDLWNFICDTDCPN